MVNMRSTDGKVLGSYEVINLGFNDGEMIGIILGNTKIRWQV